MKPKDAIIIISRDRTSMLPVTIPAWLQQGYPIVIMTEKEQVDLYKEKLRDILPKDIRISVVAHAESNMGVGYARESAVNLADRFRIRSFIMADDDTIPVRGNVQSLLDFVGMEKSIICAGWMPNYGAWIRDGNRLSKQPGLVIPRGGSPDRIFAVNTQLCLDAGNFDPNLTTLDTQEMNRLGIQAGYLWYVSTSVHIKMLNKPHDPGGIQSFVESAAGRALRNRLDHEYTYQKWGPRYISEPGKRMSTRWLKLANDFVGEWAVHALRNCTVYEENAVPL